MRLFLSGVCAFLLQASLFLLLFLALLPKTQKQYSFQEPTQLELIEIQDLIEKKPQTKKAKKAPPTPSPAKTASPKPAPVAGSDVKKLFEKIDSPNPPVREEEPEDERPLFSANTIKKQEYSFDPNDSQMQQESSKIKEALDSLWEQELEVSTPQMQDISEGEYNEWFAKIKKILYAKWENTFYESVSLTASVTIATDGSFSYRIIRYARNQSYNTYMEEMLKALAEEKFPPYPKGRITLEVVFKTKEHS